MGSRRTTRPSCVLPDEACEVDGSRMRFCAMYRRFMDYTQVCFDMSVYYNLNLVISSPKVLLCLEKKEKG